MHKILKVYAKNTLSGEYKLLEYAKRRHTFCFLLLKQQPVPLKANTRRSVRSVPLLLKQADNSGKTAYGRGFFTLNPIYFHIARICQSETSNRISIHIISSYSSKRELIDREPVEFMYL